MINANYIKKEIFAEFNIPLKKIRAKKDRNVIWVSLIDCEKGLIRNVNEYMIVKYNTQEMCMRTYDVIKHSDLSVFVQ